MKRICDVCSAKRSFAAPLCVVTLFACCVVARAETCTPTNIVVAPLTDAHWTQGAPYNGYSPRGIANFTNGWEAGCVAIAAAQELYYWQWPWRLDAVHETSHPVLNESNLALRFDGSVPFDWDSMLNSYGNAATLKQKHAAAHLVLACQSLVQMRFVSGGGEAMKNLPGTMEWFEYAGQVTPRESAANLAALKADFEFGSPVQTGINFKGYGGHEVVGLGYATGTNSVGDAKNLIWLNLGWGGGSDGWYDLSEATEGETIIKSTQLGFRPIKSVQIEPIAPISGSSVTLNWHLPNCYTNKIDGFTVAKKKLGSATTTWSDDFSTAKGRSNNTNEVRIVSGALKAWDGTASGIYTWEEVFVPTAESVMTYDVGSSYMSGMSVRFEVRVDGVWQTVHAVAINGDKEYNYYNWGTVAAADPVSLASLAGKTVQLRLVVEYTTGGIYTSDDASVKIDNLSISNVRTFGTNGTSVTLPAADRSATFSGLTTGETYAFSVTPIMSDGSSAVMQTATTTIGAPAAVPTINAVTMMPRGVNLVQEGFYADIAMGWNIIDVACSESVVSLEAFISHQSVLPQSKIEVVNNGNGSFSINIDASEVSAKWANQKMILTLKATNATGESCYKDVELCLKASGVPVSFPDANIWSATSSDWYAEPVSGSWSKGRAPTATDQYVVFSRTGNTDVYIEDDISLSTVAIEGSGSFKFVDAFNGGVRVSIETLMTEASFTIDGAIGSVGEIKRLTAVSSGNLSVSSGKSATIAAGKTWTIGGGVYLAGNQTFTVNGTLADSGVLVAEGAGTTLALAPTATVSAASLSFANNAIRLAITQDASPALSVSGAATLTDATIEVSLADGMTAGDSIALMSAGSFAGVASATLSGLDGYNLKVTGGTLCAVKNEQAYDGPAPTAVWLSGEFEDAASKHNGYSIVLPSSGISVSDGKLVVASNATTGATIDLTSTNVNKVTVLIEYSSLAAVSDKNVTLATVKDSVPNVIGARTTANGALTLTGYYDASSDNNYAFGTVPTMPSGTGYLMLMYDNTTDNSVNGTYCYAGSTIATLVGGRNSNLKWTGSGRKINEVSIGGPITANRVKAWPGVKVEKVALFVGEALTNSDIANYKFPELAVVARFVNGGDSTDYASLDEAMMALAMALFSNPNSGAYVEVVDDGLDAPNEYGSSGIGYSETERKYARAVSKLDNGTGTYPAFLNLADAWTVAGKGADTATITILSAPTDSVTIEVGQTLKVDGLALADDKVLVGENRIKHVATDNGVTTYTAKYTDAVTRLDGTIYHGNDANRAIITNYLSQMVGHRPVKMPAPNTVDLLLVYDPNAVAYATNHYSTIEEHAAHNVAVMNRALTTTDIDTNVWFRIAGIYQVDVAAAHVDDALSKLNSGTAEGWESVNAMRDQIGADIVLGVVYTNSNYGLANWCSPTAIMNGSAANSAFAGVRADAAWAWVHEVGHTASLFHNPVEAAGTYHDTTSIGCGFVKTAAADAAELRSLMDSGTVQMAFSSPNHMSHGEVYSVTNASGAWVDSSGELARLLPYMAKYRDTVVNAWTITPKSGSTVTAGDTMTVTCEDPDATIWYSRYGEETEMQYDGPVEIDTSSSWCIYNVMFKKNGETLATTMVSYMTQEGAVAKIGETYYASLAAAVAVATASQAESVEISLLKSSSDNVTLDSKTTVTEASSGLYTGTLSGSGTLVLAGTRSSALSFGEWTGVVELPAFLASGQVLTYYCNGTSKLKLNGITGGYLMWNDLNMQSEVILAGDLVLTDMSERDFAFAKISGAGNISLSPGTYELRSFTIGELAEGYEGAVTNNMRATHITITKLMLAAGTSVAPGTKLLATGGTGAIDLNAVYVGGVEQAGLVVVRRCKGMADDGFYAVDKFTDTDYPVPYSWFLGYGVNEGAIGDCKGATAANGQNKWWECYVLGLDPTNELSKFIATIRMDGTTPIVEYSPTNEVLKANGDINYVLLGKPTLTNDWSDCPSFDEPGDKNRFFRVKVTW